MELSYLYKNLANDSRQSFCKRDFDNQVHVLSSFSDNVFNEFQQR